MSLRHSRPARRGALTAGAVPRLQWSPTTWRRVTISLLAVSAAVVAIIARMGTTHSLDLRIYRQAAASMLRGAPTYDGTFANHLYFTYPPFALLFFSPLTWLSMHGAVWVWDSCNVVALAIALAVLARRSVAVSRRHALVLGALVAGIACLALEPVRSSLLDGQVNLVLIAAVVVDVFVLPTRWRGTLIGLAGAIKLTPLVFVVYFLASRERRAAVRACAAFGVATLASWLVLPSDSTTFWLHQAFSPGHKGGTMSDWNQSWWGLAFRLPASDGWVRMAVWLAACGGTLALGAYVARRCVDRGRREDALFAVAITGLLVSPVSWTHHWSWLAVLGILLLARGARHLVVNVAMALLLALTIPSPYAWHLRGWWFAPVNFSLVFAAAATLAVMGATEWRAARQVADDPGDLDAAYDLEGAVAD